MKITIYGTGYVGLVTGACLASFGNHVLCVDIDNDKVANLQKGNIPIYEPGLEPLVKENMAHGRLEFTTDAKEAVNHGTLQFICVNTPSNDNGAADISNVLTVAKTIATHMTDYRLIINKSTAPVGTADLVRMAIDETLAEYKKSSPFDVAVNPEFLKEGSAVDDFLNPDRIVVGVTTDRARSLLQELYAKFAAQKKLIAMDIPSAELTKYASNAMLATKISFINEIANLADKLGANINSIREGMAADIRIGPHFITPGCGYGGSCFPKDVKALIHTAQIHNVEPHVLTAVERVNTQQKHILFEKISHHFNHNLKNRTFAVWGLAFKPNTNDIREASSHVLLADLWRAGANVKAYDPVAMKEISALYGQRNDLELCSKATDCLIDADALVIVTEWSEFANLDKLALENVREQLKSPVIFDGRNIFACEIMDSLGFTYYGIGRSNLPPL